MNRSLKISSGRRALDLESDVHEFNTHWGVAFCYWNFLFSCCKTSDANIGIIANARLSWVYLLVNVCITTTQSNTVDLFQFCYCYNILVIELISIGSRVAEEAIAPGPVKISHRKMAAFGGHIDFMFLDPSYPAAGSATACTCISKEYSKTESLVLWAVLSQLNCQLRNVQSFL